MRKFNKKEIIIIGLIIVMAIIGGIYYFSNQEEKTLEETENLEVEEEAKEEVEQKEMKIVHISGAVQNEGIVEIEANGRVANAIEKAGGLKENACMDEINLAYMPEDGEKIHIPTIEEQKKNKEKLENTEIGGKETQETNVGESISNKSKSSENSKAKEKININTATETELDSLPGIGPSTAQKILNYREEKGKFKTVEEIKEVSGIGESKFNNIKDLITVK